jgi:DNA-binding transcriptional LysR family regulator
MDRYLINYFLAVVETGNFSRAARRVNVAQPTLSVGIAKLEAQLGARLFNRTSRRVHLTEAGARFVGHAKAIEHAYNQALADVGGSRPAARLRLGLLTTLPNAQLAEIVARARALGAGGLELIEANERELVALLERGGVDVAISLLRPGGGRFAPEPLYREGYSLALPLTHRLAREAVVEAADLAQDSMIVRRHCEVLSQTSAHFTARGVRPPFSLRTLNDERALAMVRAGLGVTVMPDGFADPGVVRPRLADFDIERDIGLMFADPAAGMSAHPLCEAARHVCSGPATA